MRGGWGVAVALREARDEAFAVAQQMIHEGVHAIRALPAERRLDLGGKSCWPEYLYEVNDHGAYEAAKWRPTPKQVDWGFKVAGWYSTWRGKDRKKNGLHKWEWQLLEARGWQVMFGRESWEDIATMLNSRFDMPTYDRTHWRRVHNQVIETGLNQAIRLGDLNCDL